MIVRTWNTIEDMLADSLRYDIGGNCVIVDRTTGEIHAPKRSLFAKTWDQLKSLDVYIRGEILGLIDPGEDPHGIYPSLAKTLEH